MTRRLFITSKISDSRVGPLKQKIIDIDGDIGHLEIAVADVYTFTKKFTQKQWQRVSSVLVNPVTQTANTDVLKEGKIIDWTLEIGFLPGVTDNVAATVREMIRDLLKVNFLQDENIFTSTLMVFSGKIRKGAIERFADSQYNPLIQYVRVLPYDEFKITKPYVPKVHITQSVKTNTVNLNVSNEELIQIGKEGIKGENGVARGPLALDLISFRAIRDYFRKQGRNPTDIELESIAQTWSEHCKHTIFSDPIDNLDNGLFRTYIKRATEKIRKSLGKDDFCVSVFTDNSGAIRFDGKYLITHKAETHNSPSALDPFGGAITGIVGVNRDAIGFGLGAKPIANTYGYCVADPNDREPLYKDKDRKVKMLFPRRILDGIVKGVNSGGNCSGIPTMSGFVYVDGRYKGKPLVFVGTVGLIPGKVKNRKMYEKRAHPGDLIVMVGGRVGLDGIHGATFSSEALSTGSPSTAVQIGDPITQKKMSDALIKEARDKVLFTSITDNGAGGLSCSVAEMAKESGGCLVNLDLVPLKYPGLMPWQIWISESQERMTLAVNPRKWKTLKKLLDKRAVEGTIIGKFNNSGRCSVFYRKKKIMDVDMKFLHDGLPKRRQKSRYIKSVFTDPALPDDRHLTQVFENMQKRYNVSGYGYISGQYDHEVQGTSVTKPLQGRGRVNADAIVVRPLPDGFRGLVLSQALYPSYSEIDPYRMAACSIDTAIRNIVSAGGDPARCALLDNFCWCSSRDPVRLWQLKESAKACFDTAVCFRTPFISGKDSMFNDFRGFDESGKSVNISVLPSLLISSISIIPDIRHSVTLDFKFPGDLIYIVGSTFEELGGSEYYAYLSGQRKRFSPGTNVPRVDCQKNIKIYNSVFTGICKDLISSATSIHRGGLASSLCKSAIGGHVGFEVDLNKLKGKCKRNDSLLFSETQGRFLLSVNPAKKRMFEKLFHDTDYSFAGRVREDTKGIINGISGKTIINTDVRRLEKLYKSKFNNF